MNISGCMTNSAYPDHTPRSDLGLHCFLRSVCPNIQCTEHDEDIVALTFSHQTVAYYT